MATHRPAQSVDFSSANGLQNPLKERRMTNPSSLVIPKLPAPQPSQSSSSGGRPPSPLRNGFIPDTSTGIDPDSDDEDDEDWKGRMMRSPSPASSSVSQQLANFVGSFVGSRSPSKMPTDAELEAEAERERDRSRREAERILTQEAMERKLVEERVLEMMEHAKALPPPPSRTQTVSNPPSPSQSQKESTNWWTMAKNKLTPTKDKELTPAQQVIQETKAREKERQRERKNSNNMKGKEKEWPANSQTKYNDPAFLNLTTPQHKIPRRPVPVSPASPTPASQQPPDLSPSPLRKSDSKEPLPIYATFDSNGTLDVQATLLVIAKRFEKLEKWTVGHVRALEERMGDVERWLVEKEEQGNDKTADDAPQGGLADLREELSELQSRMSEMGREMARLHVAPANLSSGPSRQNAEITTVSPETRRSSFAEHDVFSTPSASTSPLATSPTNSLTPSTRERYIPPSARQSTSPPLMSSRHSSTSRLPYPTGDYATPPDSSKIPQRSRSPTQVLPARSRSPTSIEPTTQPLSISGLPVPTSQENAGMSSSVSSSYSNVSFSSTSSISPAAKDALQRTTSPRPSPSHQSSPTPRTRKRYTVALGGPIKAPDSSEDEDDEVEGGETIGKKSAVRTGVQDIFTSSTPSRGPTKPLNVRSRSNERLSAAASTESLLSSASSMTGSKFVDPLVLRRQQEVSNKVNNVSNKGVGKRPVGELVKFFDGDSPRKTSRSSSRG